MSFLSLLYTESTFDKIENMLSYFYRPNNTRFVKFHYLFYLFNVVTFETMELHEISKGKLLHATFASVWYCLINSDPEKVFFCFLFQSHQQHQVCKFLLVLPVFPGYALPNNVWQWNTIKMLNFSLLMQDAFKQIHASPVPDFLPNTPRQEMVCFTKWKKILFFLQVQQHQVCWLSLSWKSISIYT